MENSAMRDNCLPNYACLYLLLTILKGLSHGSLSYFEHRKNNR